MIISLLKKSKSTTSMSKSPKYYDTFGEFSYSYHYGDERKPESSGEEGLKVVQILESLLLHQKTALKYQSAT